MKAAATTSPAAFAFPRKNMPAVTFDHSKHLKQTGMICDTCHPKIFTQKRGGNPITMPAINSGKYCGVCHNGEKAPKTCNACHKKA
ncbi:cytochrome C [Candidatus Saganbacteria bacterium]|nr:cytochrome C [Candidatus Saganbacteria bacterium]